MFLSTITPTGKPPPLAVRLEQALPFRRCMRGEDVLWGSPASQTIQKPQEQYHGEARSSGVVPRRVPSLNEECALMHPLQGASFLSTPLQGGILKPPALRVVGDYLRCGILAHGFLRLGCDICKQELLVPFSCKRRGFCPSCAGRRMAQTAAHLVEQVI